MNCWLIGVTLQCLGSNDLTFIQQRSVSTHQTYSYSRTYAAPPPTFVDTPANIAYMSFLNECVKRMTWERCAKEYRK